MLLDAHAVVKSKDGDTLLSAAMRSGNALFVKIALEKETEINTLPIYKALLYMISGEGT